MDSRSASQSIPLVVNIPSSRESAFTLTSSGTGRQGIRGWTTAPPPPSSLADEALAVSSHLIRVQVQKVLRDHQPSGRLLVPNPLTVANSELTQLMLRGYIASAPLHLLEFSMAGLSRKQVKVPREGPISSFDLPSFTAGLLPPTVIAFLDLSLYSDLNLIGFANVVCLDRVFSERLSATLFLNHLYGNSTEPGAYSSGPFVSHPMGNPSFACVWSLRRF